MKSVLTAALACVTGATEITVDDGAVSIHRAPRLGRQRLADPGLDTTSATPSGVRLEMLTDTAVLEIDIDATRAFFGDPTATRTAIDVVVDGNLLHEPVVVTDETLIEIEAITFTPRIMPRDPATVRIALGSETAGTSPSGGHERRVEIWLPNTSMTKILDVRIPDGAVLRSAPSTDPVWIHHGSSISQCSEASRPTGTWPAIVARTTRRSLVNLALAGNCHLDLFMAQAIRDRPASVISLELGINIINGDTMRERAFKPAFHGFLDTIRQGHPRTPIMVITPIFCPLAERHPGPTLASVEGRVRMVDRPSELDQGALTLIRVRELLTEMVEHRRSEGDENLHLLDGLNLFGADDVEDLPDGLHPNSAGYQRIAERFLAATSGAGVGFDMSATC